MNTIKLAIAAFVILGIAGILTVGAPLACGCGELNAKPGDLFAAAAGLDNQENNQKESDKQGDGTEDNILNFISDIGEEKNGKVHYNGIHLVKSGETLYTIAQQYSTTAEELKRHNGLPDHLIYPGDELAVPGRSTK
ncbi:LysM peptidoglycan-binding domain-containing protein [Alteribacter natronophilus]|uniref:LysM peptidoglycan-binding domain-containing protein n=1 Tax=Alteribacter natronophilus TaxID=2583810 RepID=UPI00110F4983|nr:LysM peptidoglycan-binding domain-containing protein [Alteribacter natronophilus]TMW73079.1 LysM peptidoglycan-binding domain-containing protein [Alteribacter natronophilus]